MGGLQLYIEIHPYTFQLFYIPFFRYEESTEQILIANKLVSYAPKSTIHNLQPINDLLHGKYTISLPMLR
jgi:hypothetical protein